MANNTTTSAIIKQISRALKKATQGKWCAFIAQNTFAIHTPGNNRCDDIINWPGFDGRKKAAANAAYIAAVNPENIAILLAHIAALKARAGESNNAQQELNEARQRIKELERERDAWEGVALAMRDGMREERMNNAKPAAAPVVPSFDEWLATIGRNPVAWVRDVMRESYDACRAAMHTTTPTYHGAEQRIADATERVMKAAPGMFASLKPLATAGAMVGPLATPPEKKEVI